MRKLMINKTSGITLIALVVTIIVLLILAGISIQMISGNNGILTRTAEAKETSRGGEVKQIVRLEAINNKQSEYVEGSKKSREQVISELKENGKLTQEEVDLLTDENNPIDIITIGGIEIDFSELGKDKYFYVYHSSNCMVEKIPMTSQFDITSKVDTSKYYYGGYFSEYGLSTTDVKTLTYTNNIAFDENGEAYDGSKIRIGDKPLSPLVWKKPKAYTNNGKTLHPEKDKIYYLREIPNTFLKIKMSYTYLINDKSLTKIIPYTAIDQWEECFFILSGNQIKTEKATTYILDSGSLEENVTLAATNFEGVPRGSIGYALIPENNDESIAPNWQFTITVGWTTLDGVKVYGETKTYNTGCDENGHCTSDTIKEIK